MVNGAHLEFICALPCLLMLAQHPAHSRPTWIALLLTLRPAHSHPPPEVVLPRSPPLTCAAHPSCLPELHHLTSVLPTLAQVACHGVASIIALSSCLSSWCVLPRWRGRGVEGRGVGGHVVLLCLWLARNK
jgi:hypothetical protein